MQTILHALINHSPLLYFTQSLWRDEAFSILFSERSISSFLHVTFEPPLFYFLLHFWMKLFGNSEIAARSLSLFAFTCTTAIVIYWAEKLFRKHWLSWYLPLFFFLNPTLLYYAFEIRAYAWYVLFTVLSLYAYSEKKWKLYTISTVLGLYTHTYMVIVPAVQALHYLLTHKKIFIPFHWKKYIHEPFVQAIACITLLYGPWLIKVMLEFGRLKESWYFPVDLHLIYSVLGNVFLGYEGTPWYLWGTTAILSAILLGIFSYALKESSTRTRNSLFFLLIMVPLITVIGISFYKPLFVNRYVIPVTIAQVFLIVFALQNIHNKIVQKIFAACLLLFVIGFNIWYPDKHAKLDIRTPVLEVNSIMSKQDVILVETPLLFFETIYYSKDRSRVYLYNPSGSAFPWFVGDAIFSNNQMVSEIPTYPIRAFIIKPDGTYEMAYNVPIAQQSTQKSTINK